MPEAVIVKDTVCDSDTVDVMEDVIDSVCVTDGVVVEVIDDVGVTEVDEEGVTEELGVVDGVRLVVTDTDGVMVLVVDTDVDDDEV